MSDIAKLDKWLDDNVDQMYKDQPLAQDWARVAKVVEESGESIDALIGATGQNPRKGLYTTQPDMLNELSDVALTAILAIQHFTKDKFATEWILQNRLSYQMLAANLLE